MREDLDKFCEFFAIYHLLSHQFLCLSFFANIFNIAIFMYCNIYEIEDILI